MKTKYIFFSLLFTFFRLSLQAQDTYNQTKIISETSSYINNVSKTWYITSTVTTKPLLIKYNIGTEYNWDFVNIYSIDSNNVETLLVSLSGFQFGTISSVLPTGKVKITFTSDGSVCYQDNPALYSGIGISFSIDNSTYTPTYGSSYTTGNSIINGNVGIGVLNPSYKLEVNGAAKFLSNVLISNSISFQDNARFTVAKTILPTLGGTSFSMPQYGIAAPPTTTSADLWLSGNSGIRMFTNGNVNPAVSILTNGNVGIGTPLPNSKLEVHGGAAIGQYTNGTAAIDAFNSYAYYGCNSATNGLAIGPSGNVGIGAATAQNKLHITEASQTEFSGTDWDIPKSNMVLEGTSSGRAAGNGPSLIFKMPANTDGSNPWAQARIMATPDNGNTGDARGRLYLQVRDAYNPTGVGGTWNWRTGLMISSKGTVCIGTTTPLDDSKLVVKGKITAEEVVIENVAADFVFQKDYQLKPLHEVESFINENQHLPGVAPASETVKGVELSKFNTLLLQKVEELTLYMIQLKKENDVMKAQIKAISKQ